MAVVNSADCPICMEPLKEFPVKTLECHPTHSFHEDCINQWLEDKNTCPICRREADWDDTALFGFGLLMWELFKLHPKMNFLFTV
jgi:hypothetical protein